MRREDERLRDILDAISAIERYANHGKAAFDEQELIQVWMIHQLQIIGEAANALSTETLNNYPDIPWKQIIGFRNLVVHEYFRVSLNLVWSIVQTNIPPLKLTIERILEDFSKNA
jgi:uncharacterized protein with HEPN domain